MKALISAIASIWLTACMHFLKYVFIPGTVFRAILSVSVNGISLSTPNIIPLPKCFGKSHNDSV